MFEGNTKRKEEILNFASEKAPLDSGYSEVSELKRLILNENYLRRKAEEEIANLKVQLARFMGPEGHCSILIPQGSSTSDYHVAEADSDSPGSSLYKHTAQGTLYRPQAPAYMPSFCKTREDIRDDNIYVANIALSHYNNENGTKYSLVEDETVDSKLSILPGIGGGDSIGYVHCSFNVVDPVDSSTKQLFAEILFPPCVPVVTKCMILEEGKTKLGCETCIGAVIHPI